MRHFYSHLKYLSALEVAGFMVAKRGVQCTIEPLGQDRFRVLFPQGEHGEAARRHFPFLGAMPLQQEVLSDAPNLVV